MFLAEDGWCGQRQAGEGPRARPWRQVDTARAGVPPDAGPGQQEGEEVMPLGLGAWKSCPERGRAT